MPGLEPAALDNAVNTVTADNLDLGCRMIEKAAHDKAVRDIDERLAPGYTVRCFCYEIPSFGKVSKLSFGKVANWGMQCRFGGTWLGNLVDINTSDAPAGAEERQGSRAGVLRRGRAAGTGGHAGLGAARVAAPARLRAVAASGDDGAVAAVRCSSHCIPQVDGMEKLLTISTSAIE